MDGIVINKTWIQGKRPEPDDLGDFAYQGENLAHTVKVSGKTASGTAVNITGTIKGVYLGENNVSVPLTGTISNGVASLTLTDDCYDIPGRFILSIYAQNTETLCIYCGIGHMFRTESERVSTTSVSDILDVLDKAQEVIDSIPEDYTELSNDVGDLKSAMPHFKSGSLTLTIFGGSSDYAFNKNVPFSSDFDKVPEVIIVPFDDTTATSTLKKYNSITHVVKSAAKQGFTVTFVRANTTIIGTFKFRWVALTF